MNDMHAVVRDCAVVVRSCSRLSAKPGLVNLENEGRSLSSTYYACGQ